MLVCTPTVYILSYHNYIKQSVNISKNPQSDLPRFSCEKKPTDLQSRDRWSKDPLSFGDDFEEESNLSVPGLQRVELTTNCCLLHVKSNGNNVRVYLWHIMRRIDHKWSLEIHEKTQSNAGGEITLTIMPGLNMALVFLCVTFSIPLRHFHYKN